MNAVNAIIPRPRAALLRYRDGPDGARVARLDITGVPFVVFAEKYAVSGAQPVAVFAETLATS